MLIQNYIFRMEEYDCPNECSATIDKESLEIEKSNFILLRERGVLVDSIMWLLQLNVMTGIDSVRK